MNRHKLHQELYDMVNSSELTQDFHKFYDKKVSIAGTRIRKVMQDVKKLAQDIRVEVQEIKGNS